MESNLSVASFRGLRTMAWTLGIVLTVIPPWAPHCAASTCELPVPNCEVPVAMTIHFEAMTASGSFALVERFHHQVGRSITTITFRSANGALVQHTVDGVTGEITSVFPAGSLTFSPAGDDAWLVTVVSANSGVTAEVFRTSEKFAFSPRLSGALAQVIDRDALAAQLDFMATAGLTQIQMDTGAPNGFWACVEAVSLALLAGASMAAACGTPVVNGFYCAGAVAGYLAALNQVAEACNAGTW